MIENPEKCEVFSDRQGKEPDKAPFVDPREREAVRREVQTEQN
jgi:hypothetical protein